MKPARSTTIPYREVLERLSVLDELPAWARVSHMRLEGGRHEIDVVVERADGRVVAFETKLARSPSDDDVKHLLWLRSMLDDDLLDAVIVTTGPHAYRRKGRSARLRAPSSQRKPPRLRT